MKKIINYSDIKPKIQHKIDFDHCYDNKHFEYYHGNLEREGNFVLNDTSSDEREEGSISGFFIEGDLLVDGNIINDNGESGLCLFVTGNIYANNIIWGGGELQCYGKTLLKSIYLSHYGHGNAYLNDVHCKIAIVTDGHPTSINKLNCQAAFSQWQLSPPKRDDIYEINDLYFSDKAFDFYELLAEPNKTLFEDNKYNKLLLNFFDYDELSYIFETSDYYSEKFLDIERIEYRHEEDISDIHNIINEILLGKEEPLIAYILDTIHNDHFLARLKHRAIERFNAE